MCVLGDQDVVTIVVNHDSGEIVKSKLGKLLLPAVVLGALAPLAFASPAQAYNFPFHGQCGASVYYDVPSRTKATYDHRDGSKLWYKIWWGNSQPVPSRPLDPANWAHCYV